MSNQTMCNVACNFNCSMKSIY